MAQIRWAGSGDRAAGLALRLVAACLCALALWGPACAIAPPARLPVPEHAQLLDGFVQSSPATGAAPTRRTHLRLWQDGRMLFVEIQAFDPQPSAIVARQMRRDVGGMLSEDQVTIVIDAEGAGNNAYLFSVNPHGAQFDALIYDGGQMRYDWDAIWHSEARIEPHGWSARLQIPLSVFGHSNSATWRLNAERWMPRGSERVRLAGAQPDRFVYSLGDGVPIDAMPARQQGWGLRLKPSLRMTGESSAASGTGRGFLRVEPGLEAFHESRGGLRTTMALNIDFGEAEADERSVNLTRFELFRPEKREFFLRDAGRFSFGGLVESAVIPYYSRRIGLDASGQARGLDAGLKLTGQRGGVDFGAFAARVDGGPTGAGQPEQPDSDVAVVRLSGRLGDRQRLGMMATRGNLQGTGGSSLWGLDYQFRDTAWAGNRTLEGNAWLLRSTNAAQASGAGLSDAQAQSWGGSLKLINVGPMASAELQRIGRGFNPALGYVAEDNVLRSKGTVGWWHRTRSGASLIPALDWSYRRTLDGRERTQVLNPELEYTTAAGDVLINEVFFEKDRLAEGYEPVPGLRVPGGTYAWSYLYGMLETSHARAVWMSGEWRVGGYYDGSRNDQVLKLGWKPAARWEAQVGVGRNAISLPGGRFTVRLATLRLDYTPSTRLGHSLLLQWDNVSQSLGASARLRWAWAPGRELLLALDRLGYTGERQSLQQAQTRAMLKLVWNLEQ